MERFSFSVAHVPGVTRWAWLPSCIISCSRGESLHHLNVSWTSNTKLLRSRSRAYCQVIWLLWTSLCSSLKKGLGVWSQDSGLASVTVGWGSFSLSPALQKLAKEATSLGGPFLWLGVLNPGYLVSTLVAGDGERTKLFGFIFLS